MHQHNKRASKFARHFPSAHILAAPADQDSPPQDPQTPHTDAPKRRPLPTPPPVPLHSPQSSTLSQVFPSSPPPPYSQSLPDDAPPEMSLPEEPVIMPPIPNEHGAVYDSFLCHTPPANTWITVETSPLEYVLLIRLPGFRRDGMRVSFLLIPRVFTHPPPRTLATKRRRILHVVADSWEPEGGTSLRFNFRGHAFMCALGHFERRVSFGHDAELAQVRAEFDGEMLRIIVPRRASAICS